MSVSTSVRKKNLILLPQHCGMTYRFSTHMLSRVRTHAHVSAWPRGTAKAVTMSPIGMNQMRYPFDSKRSFQMNLEP